MSDEKPTEQSNAKQAEHTPGPWRVHEYDLQRICDADPVKQIARTYIGMGVRERAEAEANARIVAAAPDLLAAAKDARLKLTGAVAWLLALEEELGRSLALNALGASVDYDGSGQTDGLGLLADLENARDRVDAAIAKAEGRS